MACCRHWFASTGAGFPRSLVITWMREWKLGSVYDLTIRTFMWYLFMWYSIYHYIHIVYYTCILRNWNKLFLRDTYIPRLGVSMAVCRIMRYVILSFLVSIVYFNCIVHDSLYYNMDIGAIWHCALVSRIPSQSIGLLCCFSRFIS